MERTLRRLRWHVPALATILWLPAPHIPAQESGGLAPESGVPTITVQSQLVLVPTEVRTHKGETIYGLSANDFRLEADGVPQTVRLDSSGNPVPLSLVVLVQCSRDTWREGPKIQGLPAMVSAMLGGSPGRVAVVDFGKELELLTGLTSDSSRLDAAFARLQPCPDDPGAATYNALAYANRLLDRDHATGRRVILLISETRDHGSSIKPEDLIATLHTSNTMVEAVAFSPGRSALGEDLKSADGAAGSVVGLVGMAIQAMRKNAAKEIANETGGEYINFSTRNGFDQSLNRLTNRIHNAYELSFVPRFPPGSPSADPGLHRIAIQLPKYPDAILQHRTEYWATAPAP